MMNRIDVVKKDDRWVGQSTSGMAVASGRTKDEAVRATASYARQAGTPTSVRIHGRDGRIQEERTYPRGADPRSSRG